MNELSTQPLHVTIDILRQKIAALDEHERYYFTVLDPDIAHSLYNGTKITIKGEEFVYRGYKTWIDLAHILHCRMLTPKKLDEHFVSIGFEKLSSASFHKSDADAETKYGATSIFSSIHKNEESSFVYHYMQALHNVALPSKKKILNLGVNNGDEFELIVQRYPDLRNTTMTGIDYCVSAIEEAKKRFTPYPNISLYAHDIKELDTLDLGRFDLLISIGTLQSSNFNYKELLMSLVQNHLTQDAALVLGFPNCRWIDGEMLYGAKMKNYNFSEMGNLYSDVIFAKKYLQQKRFRVTITGKDYIFVTATSIRREI